MTLTNSTYNYGNYGWQIPEGINSTEVLFKVSSASNPAIYDISDQAFTIAPQVIQVTAPNGGESIEGCSTYKITWDQVGVQDYVKLYYSINDGNDWVFIADDYVVDNSNFYNWVVPSIPSTAIRIKVSAYYNANIKDSSDAAFL